MNSFNCIGRIGKEPETRYTESGTVICSFSLAISDGKDKEGKDKTLWLDVKAFNKTAELIAKHFKKGSQIGISGKLEQESWEKEGQKRSKIVVIANNISFIGKKED